MSKLGKNGYRTVRPASRTSPRPLGLYRYGGSRASRASGYQSDDAGKVLKMAQTLGYQPNFAARHLKLNRKMRIPVHLPREVSSFFDALRMVLKRPRVPSNRTLKCNFTRTPAWGRATRNLFSKALASGH